MSMEATMTTLKPDEFKKLPPLLDTADLLALGWSQKYIYAVRVEVKGDRDRVPFGRVGWVRTPQANGTPNHKGKWRRSDVARILGPEWQ